MPRLPLHTVDAANPNLRQPADQRDLVARVAALERTNASNRIIDIQTKNGATEAYSAVLGASGATPLVDGAGGQMRLSYTPPVNCWWDVTATVGIVQAVSNTYHYIYGMILLNTPDVDGILNSGVLVEQNSSANVYEGRTLSRLFKLAAGTAYTVDLALLGGSLGSSWQYYHGPTQLWINAKAITR